MHFRRSGCFERPTVTPVNTHVILFTSFTQETTTSIDEFYGRQLHPRLSHKD
jgi:hypothetical protein